VPSDDNDVDPLSKSNIRASATEDRGRGSLGERTVLGGAVNGGAEGKEGDKANQ